MNQPLHVIHRMNRNLVVQAGAGTGKTYNLVKLYVHLLAGLSGNAPKRELALRLGGSAPEEGTPLLASKVCRPFGG